MLFSEFPKCNKNVTEIHKNETEIHKNVTDIHKNVTKDLLTICSPNHPRGGVTISPATCCPKTYQLAPSSAPDQEVIGHMGYEPRT